MSVTRSRSDEDTLGGVVGGFAPLDSSLRIPATYLPPAGFIGARVYKSANQTDIPNAETKITFDSVDYDTNSFFDNTNDRLTIPAGMGGKYLVSGVLAWTGVSATTDMFVRLWKNGSFYAIIGRGDIVAGAEPAYPFAYPIDLAAGDYVEMYADPGSVTTNDVRGGLNWTTLSVVKLDSGKVGAGIGATATSSSDQTITTGTPTAVTFATEDFDSDGFHSTSVNTSRLTIPAGLGGKYLVVGYGIWDAAGANIRQLRIYKNGSGTGWADSTDASSTYIQQTATAVLDLVAGDYVELYAYHERGSSLDLKGTIVANKLSIMRLDSGASGRPSGTSMPSPVTGATIFRTDLGMEFYYDGTRWLCTCPHEALIGMDLPEAGQTVSGHFARTGAPGGDLAWWVTTMKVGLYVNATNNGSNYWAYEVGYKDGGSSTALGSANTSADSASTWFTKSTTVNAVVDSTVDQLYGYASKTGSPGYLLIGVKLNYRLIGT